jgi:drug/metabolite transporter (DMT)-like permease
MQGVVQHSTAHFNCPFAPDRSMSLPASRESVESAPTVHSGVVLALAVFGISWAAPLIRLSSAPPLVIATWRLIIAEAILLAVFAWRNDWRQWRALNMREHAIAAAAGVLLALHFWSWNASLSFTTIAASVVLVNLQPAIVALGSAALLRERVSRRQIIALLLALVGALIVASPALRGASPIAPLTVVAPFGLSGALFGDLLAAFAACAAALYYLAGRRLRIRLSLVPYVTLVYGWCTIALLILALARGERLGPFPPSEWAIFAGLAAGPMLLGHTGMNWALKHLPAHVVNLTVLGEPVGASLLAMLIPSIAERPEVTTLLGGGVILGAAIWSLRATVTGDGD